jgi:hypothetical protein
LFPIFQGLLGAREGRLAFANHSAGSIEAETGGTSFRNSYRSIRQREFARLAEEILNLRGSGPVR